MKLPTKAQWLEMAEAFDVPFSKRNTEQLGITSPGHTRKYYRTRGGICWTISNYAGGDNFYQSFDPHNSSWPFWWPLDDAGDQERAFFCCMMLAITAAGDMESMIEEA